MRANNRFPGSARGLACHVIGALTLAGCVAAPAEPLDPHATAIQLEATRLDDARVGEGLRAAGKALPAATSPWDLDSLTIAAWSLRP